MKQIEVQKENVQKMQTTFGLESIISDIEKAKETKDYQELIAQSSKLQFLFSLMENLQKEGHRLLIFSMSKKMLFLVEELIQNTTSFKHLRIDGDTEISSRESIC